MVTLIHNNYSVFGNIYTIRDQVTLQHQCVPNREFLTIFDLPMFGINCFRNAGARVFTM